MGKREFNVPDNKISATDDAYCEAYGYQAEIFDSQTQTMIPNPETKEDFVERSLRDHYVRPYKAKRREDVLQQNKATIEDGL